MSKMSEGKELVPFLMGGILPNFTPSPNPESPIDYVDDDIFVDDEPGTETIPHEELAEAGFMIKGRYRVEQVVGQGSFGYVLKATDTITSAPVAIKVNNSTATGPYLVQEVRKIMELNQADPTGNKHFIVEFIDAFRFKGRCLMLCEFVSITLHDLMKQYGENICCPFENKRGLPMAVTRRISRQIVQAVKYMVDNQIIHSDLKPNNIMLTSERLHVRIIDFGSARYFTDPASDKARQTMPYRAPEVLLHLEISEKIDIWSVGCVLAEMHVGTRLFKGAKDNETLLMGYLQMLGKVPEDMLESLRNDEELHGVLLQFPTEPAVQTMYDGRIVKAPRALITFLSKQRYKIDPDHLKRLKEIALERWLMELAAKMLTYSYNRRISASKILTHPFFTIPE